jgi:7-cyano-7-deazaguanine synthase
VLVSGGLDSATALALAREQGFHLPRSVDYGQRHGGTGGRTAGHGGRRLRAQRLMRVDLPVSAARLTTPGDRGAKCRPEFRTRTARNTIMLSLALAWAEVLGARDVFIGVNVLDSSGYPDCRPEFIAAFEALARLATKAGVEGEPCHIHTPLIAMTKAEIIRAGARLGVDYACTVSCYQADAAGRACGRCDSCRLRAAGFSAAGIADPTRYQQR